MYNSILELQKAGFDVVLQCHDEAVAEVPIGTSAELINEIMATVPKWAKGLPLKAEGEILDFYKK
jgi:DNA polymerase